MAGAGGSQKKGLNMCLIDGVETFKGCALQRALQSPLVQVDCRGLMFGPLARVGR